MPRLEKIEFSQSSQQMALAPLLQQAVVRPEQKKVTPKKNKRKESSVQLDDIQQKKNPKTQKKKKDKDRPKNALNAYHFYAKDARPKIVAAGIATSMSDINSHLGAQWRALGAQERLAFERMAIADRLRYLEEEAKYLAAKNNNSCHETTSFLMPPIPVSDPVELEERKRRALAYAVGDDYKRSSPDVKMNEVINVEFILNSKIEAHVSNDVPSSSQKSLESVGVDLLIDPQDEGNDFLKTNTNSMKNTVPFNNGNKENNNASSKAGKGFIGLGKSLAAAKSGVKRLFINGESQEQTPSKPKTVIRADDYEAVVGRSENNKDSFACAKRGECVGEGRRRRASGNIDEKDREYGNNFQCGVGMKLDEMNLKDKDDTCTVDPVKENLDDFNSQRNTKSFNDVNNGNDMQQNGDFQCKSCQDEETPIAAYTSHHEPPPKQLEVKATSWDPTLAPADSAKLTLAPLDRDECASALKKMKGYPHEQPEYLSTIPEKDQNAVRKTIVFEGKYDSDTNVISLKEVTLGRSSATGIKSTLISRNLCTVTMIGQVASVTMLKESQQHAVFLNGEPLEEPVGKETELSDNDILSLYGPIDFAYRIQIQIG